MPLISSHKFAAILIAALAGAAAAFLALTPGQGQIAATPRTGAAFVWPVNHNMVVLDAAHGGSDSGAVLGDHVLEKDVTLAIVSRLRATLTANGFTIVATRDSDGTDPLSTDQRAETSNRAHAVACIVLHATATGAGVHVYTSALQPPAPNPDDVIPPVFAPIAWNRAQTAFVRQSQSLAGDLSAALLKEHLPSLVGKASMRPLDNLMCPAVAIELSPLAGSGGSATPATDANYQQRVANSLAGALRTWRDRPDLSPAAQPNPGGQTSAQGKARASNSGAGSQTVQKGPQ